MIVFLWDSCLNRKGTAQCESARDGEWVWYTRKQIRRELEPERDHGRKGILDLVRPWTVTSSSQRNVDMSHVNGPIRCYRTLAHLKLKQDHLTARREHCVISLYTVSIKPFIHQFALAITIARSSQPDGRDRVIIIICDYAKPPPRGVKFDKEDTRNPPTHDLTISVP